MKSSRASFFPLLAASAVFSVAVHGQTMQARELEAYRLNLQEQVKAGKLTDQEAASMVSKKQDEINGLTGNARANPPAGTGGTGLICQTYPDGRTECR